MAGLLPWMAIQEGIARSASVLVDNAAMVKKTVFPVETLVLSVVLAAVVNELIALVIFAIYVGSVGHLSLAWLPARRSGARFSRSLLTFGLGCIAATLTAFVRDTAHAVGILLTVVFYATPIVYPPRSFPSGSGLSSKPIRWPTSSSSIAARSRSTHHPSAGSILYLSVFCGVVALARGGPLRAGPAAFRRPHLDVNKRALDRVFRSVPLLDS